MTSVGFDLLTLEEVAALLRVPLSTVYYWRSSGTGMALSVTAVKIGRRINYRRADVERWLGQQEEPPRGVDLRERKPAAARR